MINKHQYIEWLVAKGLLPRTIKEYSYCLDNLTSFEFTKFDQANVDRFIALHKGNVARAFLKSYKEYLLRNPNAVGINNLELQNKVRFIDIPKIKTRKRKTPMVITKEEVMKIYGKMDNNKDKLLLILSFYCGLRRAELLSLTIDMFNFTEWLENQEDMGILTVMGKGEKEGTIPVKVAVMKLVYKYLPEDYEEDDLLFPKMTERTWSRHLSRAGKDALGKHIKPHTLRHSIAMHLRGNDFALDELKEFLRHEDISTTQVYSRVTPEQLREKFKRI